MDNIREVFDGWCGWVQSVPDKCKVFRTNVEYSDEMRMIGCHRKVPEVGGKYGNGEGKFGSG
jgi:hypothetical protein